MFRKSIIEKELDKILKRLEEEGRVPDSFDP